MSDHSAIEWTDATWNPVTGCSHVSEGCRHCYAETLSLRRGWSTKPWTAQNAAENVVLHPDRLDQPLRWRQPRRVFVNSMSDLFHSQIPLNFIAEVFAVMAAAPQHTFQVLTKRPERLRQLLSGEAFWTRVCLWGAEQYWDRRDLAVLTPGVHEPLPNVWLGVSCEDQATADERIPLLLDTPAAVRCISAEPLLGPIQLRQSWRDYLVGWNTEATHDCGGDPEACSRRCPVALQVQTAHLDWIIVGGESGPGARPMHPDWARAIRDECVGAGVPFFFKQVGGRTPKSGGRLLDGREWNEMPRAPVGTP